MFKLLTDEAKKEILGEYRKRKAIIGMVALSFVFVLGIIGAFPSYIISLSRSEEATRLINAVNASPSTADAKALREWLAGTNEILSVLSIEEQQGEFHGILREIATERPQGIRIFGFRRTRDMDITAVTITGRASDRRTLLDFEARLNASGRFAQIALPVSSFAKDKDIDFEMVLEPSMP